MNSFKTVTALGILAASISSAAASWWPATDAKGFECQEYSPTTGKLGPTTFSVETGTGKSTLHLADGGRPFETSYVHSASRHYRWGYEENFDSLLVTGDSDVVGQVRISIRQEGPHSFSGTHTYYYSEGGISAHIQPTPLGIDFGFQPMWFSCHEAKREE